MSGLCAPVAWGAFLDRQRGRGLPEAWSEQIPFLAAVPLPRAARQGGTGGSAEGPLSVPAEAWFEAGPTARLYHGAAR